MNILSLKQANLAGEFLRDITFPENGDGEVGGYTTFEIRDDAISLSREEIARLYFQTDAELNQEELVELEEILAVARSAKFEHEGLTVSMLNVYEGDSSLWFLVSQDGIPITLYSNNDSKKKYRWQQTNFQEPTLTNPVCWVATNAKGDIVGAFASKETAEAAFPSGHAFTQTRFHA